jgi:hypothetical protein
MAPTCTIGGRKPRCEQVCPGGGIEDCGRVVTVESMRIAQYVSPHFIQAACKSVSVEGVELNHVERKQKEKDWDCTR